MDSHSPHGLTPLAAAAARLQRLLPQTAREAKVEAVHHLRTSIRRCEALLGESLAADPKLQKRLARLRRRAGRVRDLDIQTELLRHMHLATDGGRRELLETMEKERGKQARRLGAVLGTKHRRKLTEGLKLAVERPQPAPRSGAAVAAMVLQEWTALDEHYPVLAPDNIHPFRKECKRLRYRAEAGLPAVAAATLAEALQRAQDAIGQWHDWAELGERARRELDSTEGPLWAALDNAVAASWGEALRVATQTRVGLRRLAAVGVVGRKPPGTVMRAAARASA